MGWPTLVYFLIHFTITCFTLFAQITHTAYFLHALLASIHWSYFTYLRWLITTTHAQLLCIIHIHVFDSHLDTSRRIHYSFHVKKNCIDTIYWSVKYYFSWLLIIFLMYFSWLKSLQILYLRTKSSTDWNQDDVEGWSWLLHFNEFIRRLPSHLLKKMDKPVLEITTRGSLHNWPIVSIANPVYISTIQ